MLIRPRSLDVPGRSSEERPRAWTAVPDPVTRIEDWAVAEAIDDGESALVGRVYNHARLPDGHWAFTSTLLERRGAWARTRNTLYRLGDPLAGEPPSHVSRYLRLHRFRLRHER